MDIKFKGSFFSGRYDQNKIYVENFKRNKKEFESINTSLQKEEPIKIIAFAHIFSMRLVAFVALSLLADIEECPNSWTIFVARGINSKFEI